MDNDPDFLALVILPYGAGCWGKSKTREGAIERVRDEVKHCYGTAVLGYPKKGATMQVNLYDLTGVQYNRVEMDATGIRLYDEKECRVEVPKGRHEVVEVSCKR